MLTLTSPTEKGVCIISPEMGGRIESLRCRSLGASSDDATELLVSRGSSSFDIDDPFSWGCFTMVPYCGRVRQGQLEFGDRQYELQRQGGDHALHGSVVDQDWIVLRHTSTHAILACDLGPRWPFEGTVHHEISIDDCGVSMTLTLTAHESMPAQVGWHPWFHRPDDYSLPFTAYLERDDRGIATTRRVPLGVDEARGIYDDCFIEARAPIMMRFGDVDVELRSNCSHWTVFDQRHHGLCFEPQSGPPNGVNDDPEILEPGEQLSRWFEIRWDSSPRN